MDLEGVCKRTIDLLEDLKIQEATHAWIDQVFIGNFCEIEGPPDFLSRDFQRTKCFSETLTELAEVAEKWAALNELKREYKGMVLLCCVVCAVFTVEPEVNDFLVLVMIKTNDW